MDELARTLWGMAPIFGCFGAGLLIGWAWRGRKRFLKVCTRLTTVSIWVLLLVMGAAVGSSPQVMGHLRDLAWKGLVIGIAGIAGSIVACYPVYLILFRRAHRDP